MTLGLLSSAIMGRLLLPSDYGLVAMAASAMILLNVLKDFGLTTALVQAERLEVDQVNNVFWLNLILAAGFALGGVAAAGLLATFYSEARVRDILIALAIGLIVTSSMATHAAMLRRRLEFAPLMWAEFAGQVAALLIGVSIAWLTHSYWSIVASALSSAVATALVTFLGLPWLPGRPRAPGKVYDLFRFGANLSIFSLLNYFSNQLGMIVVASSSGSSAAGHFNRAQQLLNLSGSILMQPISQVVLPALSRLQDNAADYRSMYIAILRRTAFGFAVIGSAIVLEGDLITRILLGPSWTEAGTMYRWFGLAVIAVGMASHTGNVLMSQGRVAELRNWGFGDAAIRAGSSAFGLYWGSVGVAASYAVATLFLTVPISMYIIGRKGPVSMADQMAAVRPAVIFSLLAVSFGLLIHRTIPSDLPWISLIYSCVVVFCSIGFVIIIDPGGQRLWADVRTFLRYNRPAE